MSQKDQPENLEVLSSIVDGECSEFDLRRILKLQEASSADVGFTESAVRDSWSTYQQIGSAMRGEASEGVDISSAVMAAVELEKQPNIQENVFRKLMKPASQFAVAASVAAISMFGLQQYQLAQNDAGAPSSSEIAEIQPAVGSGEQETLYAPPQGFEFSPQTSVVSTNPSENAFRGEVRIQLPADTTLVEIEEFKAESAEAEGAEIEVESRQLP